MTELGFEVTLAMPFEEALTLVPQVLGKEGFGVLTKIDVRETMKKKLDVDFMNYTILGVCNPPLAHKALTACPDIGLMLPCNVILFDSAAGTTVKIVDPLTMSEMVKDPALDEVAVEARARLLRVREMLAAA